MSESKNRERARGTGRVLRRTAGAVASGVAGVLVVRLAEGSEPGSLPRKAAVGATRWGIVASRRARAYADLGETVPPPARGTDAHTHEH
ncbi:hypothetical protein [Trujillonella humicola]|uniref:hypothetical protein n=1 Tax=Trujillonella humicola TaxID=3383699 RepID=UPI003905DC5C